MEMNNDAFRYYEFGPFRLSVTERLLMRGDAVVSLTPKLIDTLILLVENSGHVLSKDKLMDSLWPDTFVEESSLTQNISLLRRALSEGGEAQYYIETIPKRGYRFVARVNETIGNRGNGTNGDVILHQSTTTQLLIEEHDDSPSALSVPVIEYAPKSISSTWRKYTAAAIGLLIVAIAVALYASRGTPNRPPRSTPSSIAVLPFTTVGSQTQPDIMGLGMADALILRLNRIDGAVVLPTSSIYRYTNRDKDVLSIAQELRVDAVLDGTVQRDADRIRITAQLLRSSDGKALWAETFDEPFEDLFSLQDSISEKMAAAIGHQIWKSNSAKRQSTDPEAQQAYLMGLYFWNRRTKENLAKAIQYFEQAVERDPSFAQAHALLADCYFLSSQDTYESLSHEESFKRARAAAVTALALNDQIPEAHTVKAAVLWDAMDVVGADREFRRALEIDPNYAVGHLRYGYFLMAMQKLPKALNEMQRAQQLDPVSPMSNASLALVLFMTRDIDGSIKFNQRALELQPDIVAARYNLGVNYLQKRMFPDALLEFEKLEITAPIFAKLGKTNVYALAGNNAAARRSLADFLASKNRAVVGEIDHAILYANLGDKNKAFESLQKLQPSLSLSTMRLKFDPELDSLRTDPRFTEILRRHPSS